MGGTHDFLSNFRQITNHFLPSGFSHAKVRVPSRTPVHRELLYSCHVGACLPCSRGSHSLMSKVLTCLAEVSPATHRVSWGLRPCTYPQCLAQFKSRSECSLNPTCPYTEDWLNKPGCIHTMQFCAAAQRNEDHLCGRPWNSGTY
ncbi:hypothetical protein HJG60_008646 [Phyllostomus discolor]|uniref:Uncharacterized protein n=1 Tax=Phyllostomus discolor TaxID=89673 RepID=A0A833YZC4_9CHIR|nr:hypothetical protein HJG60_008646 [Phyllostomus discolor]